MLEMKAEYALGMLIKRMKINLQFEKPLSGEGEGGGGVAPRSMRPEHRP